MATCLKIVSRPTQIAKLKLPAIRNNSLPKLPQPNPQLSQTLRSRRNAPERSDLPGDSRLSQLSSLARLVLDDVTRHGTGSHLSLIHISEPTRLLSISYAV